MMQIQFAKSLKSDITQIYSTDSNKFQLNQTTKQALKQANFKGKNAEFVTVLGGKTKIIIAGLGQKKTPDEYQKVGGQLSSLLEQETHVVYYPSQQNEITECIHVAFGLLLGSYRFNKYKTQQKSEQPLLEKITFIVSNPTQAKKEFEKLKIIADSVYMARDLCSEPANVLTPIAFGEIISQLSELGLEVDILPYDELVRQGFGLLLSVAQGSSNKPCVAIIKWHGNSKKKGYEYGLVGKGVTFDSGGISLKPATGMGDMKQDMTGAGVVTATMRSLACQKVKKNIVGIVGLVENMPSGHATRPGDIVQSLSGQTVEILNTDAEGRLVLADCLTYLQNTFKPAKIIDLATLTGAILISLGEEYAGLFSNDDSFADELLQTGKATNEQLWRMPMNDAFDKMIDSSVADMKNIGGKYAGSSTAACFLGRFIQKGNTWAHLDIAGVDKYEKSKPTCPKGATGWGVMLLSELISK
ncbi:MAG: leucyl aminopeptidase [Alphaproteobacteria bacterium]|nr:leucyl aminopeptidase [Alphaproteobacteria bacterium]